MTGQSLQGLNINGLNNQSAAHAQGLQGVQTTSQKLRMQQQMNAAGGSKKRDDSGAPDTRDDKAPSAEAAANGRGTPSGQAG